MVEMAVSHKNAAPFAEELPDQNAMPTPICT